MIKYYLGQIEGLERKKWTQPGGDNCGQGVLPQVQVDQPSERDYIIIINLITIVFIINIFIIIIIINTVEFFPRFR